MVNSRGLIQKILDASNKIHLFKGKKRDTSGYVFASYIPINDIEIIEKNHIMKVKDWLIRNYSVVNIDSKNFKK